MNFVFSVLLTYASIGNFSNQSISANSSDGLIHKDSSRVGLTPTIKYATLNRFNFEDSLQRLYSQIGLSDCHLSYQVFRYAMTGYYSLKQDGQLSDKNLLTIIDFTKPSAEKRFYIIDLNENKVKYYTYTSHGRNTGDVMASQFSNRINSNQSSLGFYVTGETYVGSKGFSLKLDGKEGAFNDKMRERGVVIHEADYVSETWIKKYGRLGRSFGCPALPKELSREIINTIKNRTPVFAYFNDEHYLSTSSYLNVESLMEQWEEGQTPAFP
jgi:hypothetical protein